VLEGNLSLIRAEVPECSLSQDGSPIKDFGRFVENPDPIRRQRQANRARWLLKRSHVDGLTARVPYTRRWRLIAYGVVGVTTILPYH
jgi:hypothetical protein